MPEGPSQLGGHSIKSNEMKSFDSRANKPDSSHHHNLHLRALCDHSLNVQWGIFNQHRHLDDKLLSRANWDSA